MAESQPVISVLMPCYNAAATLDEALESLARQTFAGFEVVAVDDGSTDETLQMLRCWSKADTRFRLVGQTHQGIVAALNTGLQYCRAEIIARMDADDRCAPERLEKQLAYMQAHAHIAVLGCRVEAYPPEQVRQGLRVYLEWQNSLESDADIRREIFVESPLAHPSVMVRRGWLERVGGYQDHGWAEDYDLWLRLYLAGAQFAKLPEVLLAWRERPERLTRSDGRYSLENFLRAKAFYLARSLCDGRGAVFVWGAGMMGRRLSKHLLRQHLPLVAFVDIDPRKIGQTRRGLMILPPADLPAWWQRHPNPVLLAAVGTRGARPIIRPRLDAIGLIEGQDWWFVA